MSENKVILIPKSVKKEVIKLKKGCFYKLRDGLYGDSHPKTVYIAAMTEDGRNFVLINLKTGGKWCTPGFEDTSQFEKVTDIITIEPGE